jgi:hypothetical protein
LGKGAAVTTGCGRMSKVVTPSEQDGVMAKTSAPDALQARYGWSEDDVATALRVSVDTLGRWREMGAPPPVVDKLRLLLLCEMRPG